MSVRALQERLAGYGCRSQMEEEQALREITQEVILAGLARTDFFRYAGFQGGTCLRMLHGLNRFSEDLDFALEAPMAAFALGPYLRQVQTELLAYGYRVEIDDRSRLGAPVQQAFLKDDSLGQLLRLEYRPGTGPLRKIRVKIEVDTHPPAGAAYTTALLDFPFLAAIRAFDLPSLFAGKMHALLCRRYVKGRDWYDFLWYAARRQTLNHALLSAALAQTGPWQGRGVQSDDRWCRERIEERVQQIDWARTREDARPFLAAREWPSLELWTADLFRDQARRIWG